MKILATNIRMLRHQHNWSQEDIANRLGISIPAFSKIETGITDVNLSRIEQIANVFGVPVTRLLSDEEEEQNEEPQQLLIDAVKKKIAEREEEINALQRKVIVLYEELRKKHSVLV
ncbi:helix-turn-helix domain-containing protein [Mucilaginibacter sp. HMF5004]|uniref:helix-turn-helix domain-containing protein n=1 Tax=Mucilaginibacter rivuli TaxID=2857527 RepID=UPI001C5EB1BF|nr:helix-turn-helix transcriptional regulator [Mucilaginibacter rivuli]MBW4891320.1 helix-turn-helix domain-containing protein [Mucilaginibacter rivuli]